MERSRTDVRFGLVLLAAFSLSCAAAGCKKGGQEPQPIADRDARRGGVSRAPLPPRIPPVDAATRPAMEESSTALGPATAPAAEETLGGVHGHTFAGFENAKRVVFVCDGTGTMVKKYPFLRAELTEAINRLKPDQSFNIVFFHDGPKAAAVDARALLPADDANKRKAIQFLEEFSASGQTYPVPALRMGLALEPDVLFFLSDGEFNNLGTYENIASAIAEANRGNRTRIHTVMFGGYDAEAERAMKRIAQLHGGTHRFVRDEELGG